jgi:hypothetical protein
MMMKRFRNTAIETFFLHMSPPPASKTATMNVGAGQYASNNVAITTFPIIPPKRALTILIATPVALRFVGKTSVIRLKKYFKISFYC